mmetsp:Transcript_47754/g.104171  ORF Transcript_47754/g.104171 Transcript_47754/m.104171 type:complete len:100 (+) Transcript_47754:70-369(+)
MSSTGAPRAMALAMASLCRCPPDKDDPRSPSCFSGGRTFTNEDACAACRAEATRSSSSPSGRSHPYATLAATVRSKREGSWSTTPRHRRKSFKSTSRRS